MLASSDSLFFTVKRGLRFVGFKRYVDLSRCLHVKELIIAILISDLRNKRSCHFTSTPIYKPRQVFSPREQLPGDFDLGVPTRLSQHRKEAGSCPLLSLRIELSLSLLRFAGLAEYRWDQRFLNFRQQTAGLFPRQETSAGSHLPIQEFDNPSQRPFRYLARNKNKSGFCLPIGWS